jgi:hypothetical protein
MIRNTTTMKVLHHNDFGNIAKCKCCQDLQISLGNLILTFSEEEYYEFDSFFNEIREYVEGEKSNENCSRKYVIVTNKKGITLSLSYQELFNTIELLNFSTIMLSVNKLIGLSE